MKLFNLLVVSFLFLGASAFCDPKDEDVTITLTRAPIVGNPDTIEFVQTCMELAPRYYRFTTLPRMQPVLSGSETGSKEDDILRVKMSAFDNLETFMGWYQIHESQADGKSQFSGLLGFESNWETGYAEVALIYLPRENLLSQSGMTRKVLNLAQEIVPEVGTRIGFLKEIDEISLEPVFEEKEFKGIVSSIYCRNYPSLISAYRTGFRVFALSDQNLLGHEYILAYPPYEPNSIPAVEEHLNDNPGMRESVVSSQRAMVLLENRATRTQGKVRLWGIHLRNSGIYKAVGWTLGGIALLVSIKLAWNYHKSPSHIKL